MKEERRPQECLRDAADQPGLSAGPLPLRQPRVHGYHLPDRPRTSFAPSCPSRSRCTIRSSNSNSSACPIRPASAITPRADRSFRFPSRVARAAIRIACFSTTIRRSRAVASCGAFPRNWPSPTLKAEIDHLLGTLDYGPVRVATGTMGYKHRNADAAAVKASLDAPNYLLKIIPHVDGTPRICELVEYHLDRHRPERRLDGSGSAFPHAPLARPGSRSSGAGGAVRRAHSRGHHPRPGQCGSRLSRRNFK